VLASPKLLVCLDGGFTEAQIEEPELRQLASSTASPLEVTAGNSNIKTVSSGLTLATAHWLSPPDSLKLFRS